MIVNESRDRIGYTNHVWSKKCGNDRNCNYYRVQKITRYPQRNPERSDNKSKLPDLCQTETALHCRLQRFPRQDYSQCPEYGLSQNHGKSYNKNKQRIRSEEHTSELQ